MEREDDSHLAGEQHFLIHISALPDGDIRALRCDSSSDLGRCFQLSLGEGSYEKSLMEDRFMKLTLWYNPEHEFAHGREQPFIF